MGNLHLKIDFVTEAHIFNNVSRQKALVNLIFALNGATYREGLIKNGRRLLIFLVKCCLCLLQNMENMLFNLVNIYKRYRYIVVANQFLIKISEIFFSIPIKSCFQTCLNYDFPILFPTSLAKKRRGIC